VAAHPNLTITPSSFTGSPTGLSPGQLTTAYGVNQITFKGNVTGNGAGQTIAIIDAYHDPQIASDLSQFDAHYGLAAPPSFTQYVESGLTQHDAGWALETALDVEWAHAIAPAANLVLVEANPNDVFSAVNFARQVPGVSVVSMSWGMSEFWGESTYDSLFTTPTGHIGGSGLPGGITFVASSGDSGAWSGTQYPADSPNVVAVGGTNLQVGTQGNYLAETGWSGSGGGYSLLEAAPSYQAGVSNGNAPNFGLRTTPDVAWDGAPSTGVSVYDSVSVGGQSGWFTVGGTSAGAPAWAGLIAIADQGLALAGKGSLSNAQASLYHLPATDFNAITTGSNGYHAGSGYNLVTGLGSPKANLLVAGLVKANGGGAVITSVATPHPADPVLASPHDIFIVSPPPPSVTSGAGTGGTSTTGSGTSSTASITALTPIVLAVPSANGRAIVIVIVVPQPLFAHLGPSTAPATTLSLASLSPNPDQSTVSHFGQDTDAERLGPEQPQPIAVKPQDLTPIDIVEPFQPPEAEAAPGGQPAAPPSAARARKRLPDWRGVETVLDWTERGLLPRSPVGSSSPGQDRPDEVRPSCGLSTLFGAAVVAAGGYHLALRQPDRFAGRWIPGRLATRRRRFEIPIR
jgi:hypothetical protein